jgi:hypothetical protein
MKSTGTQVTGKKGTLIKAAGRVLLGAIAGGILAAFFGLIISLVDKSVPYWIITIRLAPNLIIIGAFVTSFMTSKARIFDNRLIFSMFWALIGYYTLSTFSFYVDVIIMLTGGKILGPSYGNPIGFMMGAIYGFVTYSSHSGRSG